MFKYNHRFLYFIRDLDRERNNGRGEAIKLTYEIADTNRILEERSNYQLEARVEQAMPSYIPTDRCVIM